MTSQLGLKIYRYLSSKAKHPCNIMPLSSQIDNNTIIHGKLSIGANTTISHSTILGPVIIGDHCSISNSTIESNTAIHSQNNFSKSQLGSYSYIANNTNICKTNIGRFCSIGPHLICGIGSHPTGMISTSPIFYSTIKQCGMSFTDTNHFDELPSVSIGNDVWIGANVFIKNGITIHDGAIIAAGAVVIQDIPSYSIVGGVPAKLIRNRYCDATIQKLLEIKWWNWSEAMLRLAQNIFIEDNLQLLFQLAETIDE